MHGGALAAGYLADRRVLLRNKILSMKRQIAGRAASRHDTPAVGSTSKSRGKGECMVIVKANKDSEAGVPPNTEILTAMGKFN